MNKSEEMRYIQYVTSAFDGASLHGGTPRWQLAFGALLYFIRDKNMGKPFNTDMDISLFHGDADPARVWRNMEHLGFRRGNQVVDSAGDVLKMDFKNPMFGFSIDLFYWKRKDGFYWHTFDSGMEFPKDGRLRKYVFKGTPCYLLDGDEWEYRWFDECDKVHLPRAYGAVLDYWYPGWFIVDKNFGYSRCTNTIMPEGGLL